MRRVVIALLAITSLALARPTPAAAQGVSVVFRNESPVPIIVQGWSLVNGVQRRGAPVPIPPTRNNVDIHVPLGLRSYSVYHANQPALVLLRDFPVPVDGNLILIVRPSRQNPMQAEIVLPGTP